MFDVPTKTTSLKLSEKRLNNYDQNNLWDKLNFCQQFSVCSLGQFGYVLTYVRVINDSVLAILKLDNKVATINEEGLINVSPDISIRQ